MTNTPDNFAGLSRTQCCDACTPARCQISEQQFCWHPRKSGMPSSANRDPEAVTRYEAAQNHLLASPTKVA
jgi:hypothetical protein